MAHPVIIDHVVSSLQFAALLAAPDLPTDAWWLPALVLFVLGVSATIDALTGTIPDWIIFLGLAAVLLTQGLYVDWPFAAAHLRIAIAVGVALWFLNALCRRAFKGDVYGMGDAKWTMLAVAVFGFIPALFAWGAAAVLATGWIGGARLIRRKLKHVYLGPFLFVGLLIGLYWLKLR